MCWRELRDVKLDDGKGGVITKISNGFDYNLNDQPEAEGESFVGVYPPATSEVKWRVMFHGGEEARAAYREFTLNPKNGQLYLAA